MFPFPVARFCWLLQLPEVTYPIFQMVRHVSLMVVSVNSCRAECILGNTKYLYLYHFWTRKGYRYLKSWKTRTLLPWIFHDDVIKWKHFPRYWPFVRGIHRSPMNSLHKGQWRGALMFSLICVWIYGWVNNREAGDLRRNQAHYDVIVMQYHCFWWASGAS